MHYVVPAISQATVDELRKSTIPDALIRSIGAFFRADGVGDGICLAHVLSKPSIYVCEGESTSLEGEHEAFLRIEQKLHELVRATYGEVECTQHNRMPALIPTRPITQRSVADLVERCLSLPEFRGGHPSCISISLDYDKFSDDTQLRDILFCSGINIRKLSLLQETGGSVNSVLWRGKQLQIYEGRGARFDEGRIALAQKGFKRYLEPEEAFQLTADLHDSLAPPELSSLLEFGRYEWVNRAWRISDGNLTMYCDPSGLVFDDSHGPRLYREDGFTHSSSKTFNIAPLLPIAHMPIPLGQFDVAFVISLTGKPFRELHPVLQEVKVDLGYNRAGHIIPAAYWRTIGQIGQVGCNGSVRGIR